MSDQWSVLNYEIQQYIGARWLQGHLPQIPKEHPDKFLTVYQNTLVELKALHIRILTDIFLPKTAKNPDDIDIEDLIPDWRKTNSTVAVQLENDYKTPLSSTPSPKICLNKYLFHPDKLRGSSFDWADVIRRMDPSIKAVLKTLPVEDPRLNALGFFRKYLDDKYEF
jgi:hypothetical protein